MPESSELRELPASAPQKRRLSNLFIAVFLAIQVGVPLRYYLGARDYDERFSWRMFSSVRLRECEIRVTETVREGSRTFEQPVDVQRDVQVAWVRLLERMRNAVVDKYLSRRCQQPHVERVNFQSTCQDTDGHSLPTTRRSLQCATEGRHTETTL